MAALSKGFYINFISLVLQKVAADLINEVAALLKLNQWDGMENMFGLPRPGHYNEVALIMRWLLSEVLL